MLSAGPPPPPRPPVTLGRWPRAFATEASARPAPVRPRVVPARRKSQGEAAVHSRRYKSPPTTAGGNGGRSLEAHATNRESASQNPRPKVSTHCTAVFAHRNTSAGHRREGIAGL